MDILIAMGNQTSKPAADDPLSNVLLMKIRRDEDSFFQVKYINHLKIFSRSNNNMLI